MKIYRFVPVALLLCIFTFTNIASAYSAPSLAALSTQLQGLLLQLHALLGVQSATLTAATTVTPVATPRTCQVNIYTRINGVEKYATTTMSGAITDQFAIGLSIGTSSRDLPFGVIVQSQTWGKGSTTATAEYFTPAAYTGAKATLAAYALDPHYKVLSIPLDNVNNPNSSTTFSAAAPYAEGLVTNDAISPDIQAGKATVRANVMNCTAEVVPPPVQNTKKPNILYVLADDLDMQTMTQLPKLKALMADKGMTFDNSFVSLSLCCPSRAATLCGQYAHNNGVFTNDATNTDGTNGALTAFLKAGDDKNTMAVWLQNAGYRTALMGKYLNGYDSDKGVGTALPPGWSEWAVPFDGNPYSQYNYTLNANGVREKHYLPYCTSQGKGPNCEVPGAANTSTFADRQEHFMMNVLEKKATDLITRSSKDGTPFFLYLAPYAPHDPATPAPKDEKLITDASWLASHPLPKSASFNEADITDKPTWLKPFTNTLLTPGSISEITDLYHKRVISMYAVEDMLSDLIATLDKNGQLDNTYIVFMSDNGFHLGQHRLEQGKLTEFDTDLRVPLIIRGPNVPAGSKSTQLVANVDITPTFLSLANVKIPASVDGRSFKETLLGGTSVPRNALLIEHAKAPTKESLQKLSANTDERRDTATQSAPLQKAELVGEYRGIRTPQYTYVHYATSPKFPLGEEELYDNVNDPEQLTNVADGAGATFMALLRKWTADLAGCKGEQCRKIEAENRLSGVKGALGGKSCFIGGQQINNGEKVTLYKSRTVEKGQSCEAIKQIRTCTDGVLDGSVDYNVNTCSTLERFTGINMNGHPENLDIDLMNKAGAEWVRVIANFLPYYIGPRQPGNRPDTTSWETFLKSTTTSLGRYDYSDWNKFIAAHKNGKKGMINIEWDFAAYNLRIPAASSPAEIALFKYLDTIFLPTLLPYADIIVVGNEPFLNTMNEDLFKKQTATTVLESAPIATFYKRVVDHINTYMVNKEKNLPASPEARSKHKLYLGAFTRLYGTSTQNIPAVVDLLDFANNTSYIDGVDIHTHGYSVGDITRSLDFVTKHVTKPITDTEYSYVYEQGRHLDDYLIDNDNHSLSPAGLSFLDKYIKNATATKSYRWRNGTTSTVVRQIGQQKYTATTTVAEYMGMAATDTVPFAEWSDFFKSRSWTIENYLLKADAEFKNKKYNVNGVTFGFMQGGVGSVTDGAPWFMVPVYASSTVQHLSYPVGTYQYRQWNGDPQGNYQNLNDFQKINHVKAIP